MMSSPFGAELVNDCMLTKDLPITTNVVSSNPTIM